MFIHYVANGASLYPLLLDFHLQIIYRKERNLQIGVDKLVRKASMNLYVVS